LPYLDPHPEPSWVYPYTPLLKYPGPYNLADGTVAMAHRAQPSLEYPGFSYFGRSIYTTFGLEGVNNSPGRTSREDLLAAFLDWAKDEPLVTIADITTPNSNHLTSFEASLLSNIAGTQGLSYRWDFGDGSAYTDFNPLHQVDHLYQFCGMYHVRVEAVDSWGNHALGKQTILATHCTQGGVTYMPVIRK